MKKSKNKKIKKLKKKIIKLEKTIYMLDKDIELYIFKNNQLEKQNNK